MKRLLGLIASLAALVAALTAVAPASALTQSGLDATHQANVAAPLPRCSTDYFGTGSSVGTAFPTAMTSPQAANYVGFTAAIERSNGVSYVAYTGPGSETKPWYYNWAQTSGALYYPLWQVYNSNPPRSAFATVLSWTGVASGYYRLTLYFYWWQDGRSASVTTDPCKIGTP